MQRLIFLATLALIALPGCVIPVDQYGRPVQLPQQPGARPRPPGYAPSNPGYVTQLPDRFPVATSPRVQQVQGGLILWQGSRVQSRIRTAMPNVERWRLTNGDSQIIVKSRGSHGPATVELFDTATGTLRDKVLSFAIRQGGARWAYGFED